MADISDVRDALAALIAARLYPGGTSNPASTAGPAVRIIKGWPRPENLDATISPASGAPGVVVSVYALTNMGRSVLRAMVRHDEVRAGAPTVALAVDPTQNKITVTGSGSAAVTQFVGVMAGPNSYDLAIQAGHTPDTIAAALAALIEPDFPGTSSAGGALTIPTAPRIAARVGVKGQIFSEVEREQVVFQITVWSANDADRSSVGRAVREALAKQTRFGLPDGSSGHLSYRFTNDADTHEKYAVYRRDIHYFIEFSTFDVSDAWEVTLPGISVELEPSTV